MSDCPCNVCTRYRVYTSYALIMAIALACGLTAGAILERFGL